MKKILLLFIFIIISNIAFADDLPSICYGSTKLGRLENGWQLPSSGKNFEAYSSIGTTLGRNYVHSKVYKVVIDAYKLLETTAPNIKYIYGESGFKEGGEIKPHKTHQNGLSVDFFVPVINKQGASVQLPIGVSNKFGYNIEFDKNANYEDLTIDFEAMAKHLIAIKQAADANKVGISVVIFDNEFQKKLFETPTGKILPKLMTFSVKNPWVRHDEHYHIDFDVSCEKFKQ